VRRPPQAPTAPKINSPAFEDFLLEPGSGKPSPRDAAATPYAQQPPAAASSALAQAGVGAMETALEAPLQPEAIEAAPESADAQANFIAAVRRAQQTVGGARDGGTTGNQLLDEARARARAAAAEAEAQQTKKSGGGFNLKTLFSGRKRSTTAAGLTGLVVVLGALQAASMFYQTDKARTTRTAENIASAPAAAKQPEKTVARAEVPRLGPVSPPADRFAQTAPLADMTPVASVPVNSSVRAVAPAAPRDPFKLAAAGDAHAQYELGVRFAEGRFGPRDQAKAIEWLTKSAAQNFAPAQYRLGVVFEKGVGAARDSERARALYTAAAESGNIRAMHNLGALLADGGADGKPDYAGAARWFKRAAEHGVRDSQYNLAILSARGLGVPQDLVESYTWFLAASLQGDADAGAKLKEIAGRMDAAQLARAQAVAKAQRTKPAIPAANEPVDPEGGWATAPEPTPAKPTASRSQNISSLQTR
jgi:localization factor PodJL